MGATTGVTNGSLAATRTALAALLCATGLTAGARAQTVLRVADSLPANHVIAAVMTKPFMAEVQRLTESRLKLQYFPGEQLGKARDLLALTQAGVADIGYVGPDYASEKMPLSAAFELPGVFPDYCRGTRALWATTHGDGYLARTEFAPNRIVPLMTLMLPRYQVLLSSAKPVAGLAGLGGLKIRSAGGAMDLTLRDLGAVPVKMTPPEVYESMSRGTIDGAVLPYISAASYGMEGLVRQGSDRRNFGTVVLTYSIGLARWKRLAEGERAALLKAGEDVSLKACGRFEELETAAEQAFAAKGMRTVAFSPADDRALDDAFAKVADEWARSLEGRGKPGLATLAAVRAAVAEAK